MQRRWSVLAAAMLASGLGTVMDVGGVSAATFAVTNNDAAGPGSFAQAVLDAAANPGPDVITFDPATNGVPIPADVTINEHDVDVVGNGIGVTVLGGELSVNTGTGASATATVSDMTVDELNVNSGGVGATTVATFTDVAVGSSGGNINSGFGGSTMVTFDGVEIAGGGLNINSGFDDSSTTVAIDGSRIVDGITTNSLSSTTEVTIVNSTVTVENGTFDVLRLNEVGTSVVATASTFANGDTGVDVSNGASFEAVNSTFSDLAEAAFASTEGTIALQNVTIADVASGFAIADGVAAEIGNTIVTGVAGDACVDAQPTSLGGNFADDPTCGLGGTNDQEDLTVMLAALADNGGPTLTRLPADGSPVIDGGVAAGCPATDQRGTARPQDGDGDTVDECDSGAVEIAAVVTTTTSTTTTTIAATTTTVAPTVSTLAPTTAVPTPILPPTGRNLTSLLVALVLVAVGIVLTSAGHSPHRMTSHD